MITDDKADGSGWMIYFCGDIARSADCYRENSRSGSRTASDRAGTLGAEVERAWCWLAFGRAGVEACDVGRAARVAEDSGQPGRFRS